MTDSPAEDEPDEGLDNGATTHAQYVFDPSHLAVAVLIVDGAYATLDEYEAASAIHCAGVAEGIGDTPLLRELWLAASYRLRSEISGKPGCDLGPVAPDAEHPWPPAIAMLAEDVIDLWRALAAGVTVPAAVARFEDLLFVRRDGNGRDRAMRAAEAYLTAVDSQPLDMHSVHALLRVWSLARSVRDVTMDAKTRTRIAQIADHILITEPGKAPGVALPLLSALALGPVDPTAIDPEDVDGMLARAAGLYKVGYLASRIAVDRRKRAGTDPVTLEQIARDEVAAYFAHADAAPNGAVRMVHLEATAKVATQRGLRDLAREAAVRMQRIEPSELGMQRIAFESTLPRFISEAYLAEFTCSGHWRDGLAYFFAGQPPSGALDDLKTAAKNSGGTLAQLFKATIFGAGGLPRASTGTEQDKEAHDMSLSAQIAAENYGRLTAEGLRRIAERYGVPSEDDLMAALVDAGARDAQLARSLAKSFRHFWADDYESCIDVIVPKFEAAARSLLRELDEGIYRVQKGPDPGGYVGLYTLLKELETLALDESWAYFFNWLLLGPYGANLRNDVAHGFTFDPGPTYAALTLRAVSVLVLVAGPLPDDCFDATANVVPAHPRQRTDLLQVLAAPIGTSSWTERVAGHVASWFERAGWRTRSIQARIAQKRRTADN